jgi:transposase
MSLHPRPIDPIPEAIARVARQAFPKGNRYILLRDELGTIYTDVEFAPWEGDKEVTTTNESGI